MISNSKIKPINVIINEEILRFNKIYEEYSNTKLYGYHVTSKPNVESIKANGFKVGERKMQGKGFYSFYDFDHAFRYGMKGEINDPVIIKFEITCKSCILYLNTKIAKEVLGNDYHLKDQVNNYFKHYSNNESGLEFLLKEAKAVYNPNMDMNMLIAKLNEIEINNTESNQRVFCFYLISSNTNDNLNICWDGNYGLEYRLNYLPLTNPIGYYDLKDVNNFIKFQNIINIPQNDNFKELINFIGDNYIERSELLITKAKAEQLQLKVRNNREYDYLNAVILSINKLI